MRSGWARKVAKKALIAPYSVEDVSSFVCSNGLFSRVLVHYHIAI